MNKTNPLSTHQPKRPARAQGKRLRMGLFMAAMLWPVAEAAEAPVNLRGAARFAVLAHTDITSVPTASIMGDVGLSPSARSKITGLTPVEVMGSIFAADDGGAIADMLTAAKLDLTTAYNDAAGRSLAPVDVANADLGGLTLAPGLYKSTGTLGLTGNLTLDGQGDGNAVFIFQAASQLTAASDSQVILMGGARPENVFWQVGSRANIGTRAKFKGTIMAYDAISLATGATLDGRAMATTGAVTMESNTINLPTIGPVRPHFGPITRVSAASVMLVITNTPGLALTLQASPNLTDWTTIGLPVLTTNPQTYNDTTASAEPHRFYRAFYP